MGYRDVLAKFDTQQTSIEAYDKNKTKDEIKLMLDEIFKRSTFQLYSEQESDQLIEEIGDVLLGVEAGTKLRSRSSRPRKSWDDLLTKAMTMPDNQLPNEDYQGFLKPLFDKIIDPEFMTSKGYKAVDKGDDLERGRSPEAQASNAKQVLGTIREWREVNKKKLASLKAVQEDEQPEVDPEELQELFDKHRKPTSSKSKSKTK